MGISVNNCLRVVANECFTFWPTLEHPPQHPFEPKKINKFSLAALRRKPKKQKPNKTHATSHEAEKKVNKTYWLRKLVLEKRAFGLKRGSKSSTTCHTCVF